MIVALASLAQVGLTLVFSSVLWAIILILAYLAVPIGLKLMKQTNRTAIKGAIFLPFGCNILLAEAELAGMIPQELHPQAQILLLANTTAIMPWTIPTILPSRFVNP